MAHVDALINFTQQALLDTKKATEALNEEQKQNEKSCFTKPNGPRHYTAAQGGTCAIIKIECCVYIPDLSSNVSDAINNLQHQILSMQDSSPSFWEQVKSLFESDWWKTCS